ncbi:MAG: cell division ATP-binding protein FtsE [Candidatus Pacebacteria bacterium]|nr:cell division ATP-binding protein FtsE [Candidatus Paceibacterota bacterium]
MIKFENITKIYPAGTESDEIVALEDVSFEIKKGEFILIVGRSGAGKTTLLKLLLAEEKPTNGKITFEDQDIHKIKSHHLPELRKRIGSVFQDYKLLSSKNAFENVAYALEVVGANDEEIKRDVPKVLEIVGLKERAFNFPKELSGGEKQRAAIARALIHRPNVILADEPTGNLDPYNSADIIQLLLKINKMGTTVILATHDRDIINTLKKRVITLDKGRVVKDEEKGKFIL